MESSELTGRIRMIRQMLSVYDREPTEDRIKGYLTVTGTVPFRSLQAAIANAMESSGPHPPGPGEILMAWRWFARHPKTSEPETGFRIGPGDAARQIGEPLGNVRVTARMEAVQKRAKELVAEGRYVPKAWAPGYHLGHVKAAIELGVEWPLTDELRDRLSDDIAAHEEAGGDGNWWREECKNPTVTRCEKMKRH